VDGFVAGIVGLIVSEGVIGVSSTLSETLISSGSAE
jgi:hypothetical protein